jgi:hypothetical protein
MILFLPFKSAFLIIYVILEYEKRSHTTMPAIDRNLFVIDFSLYDVEINNYKKAHL